MLNPKPISLTSTEREGTISLSPSAPILKDETVLRSRIQKADYALAEASPGQAEIQADFYAGMEDRVRQLAALEESVRMRRDWQQTSADIVRSAALEGRELLPEEQAFIRDVPLSEVVSDRTALEERYARRVVRESMEKEITFPEAERVAIEAEDYVTKQQIAQRVYEGVRQRYDDASWASWGADMVKSMVPFYTWAKTRNRVSEGDSIMTGANIAEQMRDLYYLPKEEFEERLSEAVNSLADDNVVDAVMLAEAAMTYSTASQLWDNAFFGLDVVDVATLGATAVAKPALKGAAKAVGRIGDVTDPVAKAQRAYDANREAFSLDFGNLSKKAYDVAEESANPNMTQADLLVVKGDTRAAAELAAKDKLQRIEGTDPVKVTTPSKVLDDLQKEVPGLFDPKNYLRSAGSLVGERQRRLLDSLQDNQKILARSLVDLPPVVRVDDAAADLAFKKAEEEFRRTNFRLEDAIVEVSPVRESVDVFGGVDHIQILLGKKDALGFESVTQAENYARNIYRLPEGAYTVRQKGSSFYLGMERTVDETAPDVLDLRVKTNQAPEPNMLGSWIHALRNPDDTSSREAAAWAKVATYGGNAVMARMSEVAKSIGRLGKNESDRLRTVMDEARFKKRAVLDPETNETVMVSGRFYKDIQEFEQAYLDRGFDLPSDKEIEAYFSFRQLMDYDWAVRNIATYRDKARLGINQKAVNLTQVGEDGKKKLVKTDFFEGKTVESLPSRSGSPFTVAWSDAKTGKTSFGLSSRMHAGGWESIDKLLAQGYKIVQVANPKEPKLRGIVDSGGEGVNFIVTRDLAEKPLSGNQVPWNEGGHWLYPQVGMYVKQAATHRTKYGRRVYDGDVTAHYFRNSDEAKRFQEAYETARRMVLTNDPNLDAFAQANLPYSGEEFRRLFKGEDNPDGAFDLNSPFVTTTQGQRTVDVQNLRNVFGDEIVEGDEYSLLNGLNQQYSQSRGERLTTVLNTGTEANPIFKLEGAPIMDSMEALARSSAQLAKSRYFDDYKTRVSEDWITQFADTLDVPITALRADPFKYVRDAEKYFRQDYQDPNKLAAAKTSRRSMLYLLNTKSDEQKQYSWFRQKIVNSLTSLPGSKKIVDPMLWKGNTDPTTIARSSVFHLKLGLLNPVQFPLQAQAVFHAGAIDGSPIRAAQANFLYWSMRMRGMSEGNAGAQGMFARGMSRALGVPQEHVEEMYSLWKRTGMSEVEGEYARLDDYLNPADFYNAAGVRKGLNAATIFFKEGNRTHKGVSFATAYLRHRAMNPDKTFDARDIRQIVERADLYYLNMSRASNNALMAEGLQSVPLQFTTFHKNVMEQMLGGGLSNKGRLTRAEKARVMLMYSTLYGMPIGAGTTVAPFWPVSESIDQYLAEEGIDTDSSLLTRVMHKGAIQVATSLLAGEEYNFSDRYGPGGLTWLRDILDGEFLGVAAGPSGSTLADLIETVDPFARAIMGVFTGDTERYPLTKEDFIDVGRNISSLSNAARAYYAVTAGAYMTRSDTTVMKFDADGVDAVMMGVFGMSPQAVSDTYLKLRSNKQVSDAKAEIGNAAMREFNRAAKASADGNEEEAETFYRRAMTLIEGGDFTPIERGELRKRAMRDNATLLDKVDRRFMMNDPEKRMNNYLNRGN